MKGRAVITGADGGMGMEITRAVASAGYEVVMLCYDAQSGIACRNKIVKETGNDRIRVRQVDLSDMYLVWKVAQRLLNDNIPIRLLMNNAGTMCTHFQLTPDGLERTVAVNYVAPYLLTRMLLPLMEEGTRVVCMVSCTYAIGKITPEFLTRGKKGCFWRIPIYSNTKLALWLFVRKLALLVKEKGILVNAADPGIVSTDIIRMDMWFDPLTDIFFRPFIRTPKQGAATAIHLLLDELPEGTTGKMFASCKERNLSEKYLQHPQMDSLWKDTEDYLREECKTELQQINNY